MDLLMTVGLFVIGLFALLKGADIFTEYSSKMAHALGVSPFIVGVTLVGFATSLPELSVSVTASYLKMGSIALGNVIGSNIANIGLVMGVAALGIIAVRKEEMEECLLMIGLSLLAVIVMVYGIERWEGFLLFSFIFLYMFDVIRVEAKKVRDGPHRKKHSGFWIKGSLFCLAGVVGVLFGSRLVVNAAQTIATVLGVSEAIIGITIIAVGTSLPELSTTLVALMRGRHHIALGNIIGSNMFNISAVLGSAALANRILVPNSVLFSEVPIMFGFAALLYVFMKSGSRIDKKEGLFLLICYFAFVITRFV